MRPRRGVVAAAVVLLGAVAASCSAGSSTAIDDVPSHTPPPTSTSTAPPSSTTDATTTPLVPTTAPPVPTTAPRPPAPLPEGLDGVVASITDGDTIRARLADGTEERVRLIGIDTPETRDPRVGVECFGREASARMAELLPVGTKVRLERDVEPRDRYGRMLAYVWRVGDGLHVNEAMVAEGWATPFRYPPNVRYADRFTELGLQARVRGVGLWGACVDTAPPADTAPTPIAASPPDDSAGACDANYAGACVPPSSSDLDCADVGASRFQVVGADPHGFDGDHDGVACES